MTPERRLIEAVAMLVRRKVEEELPPHYQGRADASAIATHMVNAKVIAEKLNDLIEEIVAEITTKLPPMAPVRARMTGSFEILDNKEPCDKCSAVRPVATVAFDEGRVLSVECRECTEEKP